ncbi:MAG: AtpZ/AtpI family protein [Syntrophobacteraceae bacterium]|jgi:ATP synthase protein I|nr:AtpZ/AtpI family protein [Syntrophobacteraceae bacterium]
MKRETKEYIQQIATGTSMGLQWGLAVLIGLAVGWWLDSALGTTWLKLVFLVMGVIAGFRNYYRYIRQQQKEEQEKNKPGGL